MIKTFYNKMSEKELRRQYLNELNMRKDLEQWLMTNHLDVWNEYIKGLEEKYGGK